MLDMHPPFVRRNEIRSLAMAVPGLIALLVFNGLQFSIAERWLWWGLIGIAYVILPVGGIAYTLSCWRELVRLTKPGSCPCGHCGYDLTGRDNAPASQTCSECGEWNRLDCLRGFWDRYMRMRPTTGARSPQGMPRWVTRQVRASVWSVTGLLFLLVIPVLLIPWRFHLVVMFGAFMAFALIRPIDVALRRVCRRVRAANGMICPTCGTDLQGTLDAATCPKCKVELPAGEVKKVWDEWCPACWDIEEMGKRPV